MSLPVILTLSLLLSSVDGYFTQSQSSLGPGRKYTTIERMRLDRLQSVHEGRLRYEQSRKEVGLKTGYNDYRAILHAHAEDAPHTGGTRPEMLEAAKRAGVRVIMLTDHRQASRDFITDSWRGLREGVLFIPGAEAEGFLAFPLASIGNKQIPNREDFIRTIKQGGGNIFLSHVEEKLDWATDGLDGLEIYNHHTDIKDEVEFSLWLRGALTDVTRLNQVEQALALYPQEVIAVQQDYLSSIIEKWDRDARHHRLTAVAANDCHHNQVFTVSVVDDKTAEISMITSRPTKTRISSEQVAGIAALVKGHKPGDVIAKLDFDPYERSFRYVATHILAERLTEENVRDALRRGHAYVAHDWMCDATGFAFIAESRGRRVAAMGDEASLSKGFKIKSETPVNCVMKLFHNGVMVKTTEGRSLDFEPTAPGVYRIEAWLKIDGEQRPWIYSNPIYIE